MHRLSVPGEPRREPAVPACIEKASANAVRNSGCPLLTMAFVDDYGGSVAAKYGSNETAIAFLRRRMLPMPPAR